MTQNPWKMTAIGMMLVAATALVTTLVVAGRSTRTEEIPKPAAVAAAPPAQKAAPSRPTAATPVASRVPDQATIAACNQEAAKATAPRDKTVEVVKDAAIGAVVGAAVGAAGGAIADGGKGAGKGAAIGGLVGAGAGTLYGINDNRKQDAAYRDAYAGCMRAKGYAV